MLSQFFMSCLVKEVAEVLLLGDNGVKFFMSGDQDLVDLPRSVPKYLASPFSSLFTWWVCMVGCG